MPTRRSNPAALAAAILATASTMLLPAAADAQGWAWTPPAGSESTPQTSPAPAATVGTYGTYGGSATGYGRFGATSNTTPYSSGASAPGYGTSGQRSGSLWAPLGGAQQPGDDAAEKKAAARKDDSKKEAVAAPAVSAAPRGLTPGKRLQGYPRAQAGDTLSFSGEPVHLAGIRAPGIGSVCRSGATVWRCGEAARQDLERLVSGHDVICTVTAAGSPPEATCIAGRDNLSTAVIADGMALTVSPDMTGRMDEARADGRGIWAPGGR